MADVTYYRQCKMVSGGIVTYGWIPDRFAILGRTIIMRDMGPCMWTVVHVGSTRMPQSEVSIQSRDHEHQRRVSDV